MYWRSPFKGRLQRWLRKLGKVRAYLIIILVAAPILICKVDNGGDNNLTPLPPDLPEWYTPQPPPTP